MDFIAAGITSLLLLRLLGVFFPPHTLPDVTLTSHQSECECVTVCVCARACVCALKRFAL